MRAEEDPEDLPVPPPLTSQGIDAWRGGPGPRSQLEQGRHRAGVSREARGHPKRQADKYFHRVINGGNEQTDQGGTEGGLLFLM